MDHAGRERVPGHHSEDEIARLGARRQAHAERLGVDGLQPEELVAAQADSEDLEGLGDHVGRPGDLREGRP